MRFNRSGQDSRIFQLVLSGSLLMLVGSIVGFAFTDTFLAQVVGAALRILGWSAYTLSLNLWLSRQGTRSTAFQVFLWVLLLAIVGFQIMSLWFGWVDKLGPAS